MTTGSTKGAVDAMLAARYCLSMRPFPLTAALKRFGARFTEAGYELYIVGGAVRDYLLGLSVQDYDFATDATPQAVQQLFRRVIPTGIEHGTVTVLFEDAAFEVTTFRTDGTYLDGRRPTSVSYVTDLSEDLRRRDFTINAFAADCTTGTIIDLHQGAADLKAKTIRAIGSARERFEEDGLRILRAARFSAKLGFSIEADTLAAMESERAMIDQVSAERIREELFALVASDHPKQGLTYLHTSRVLERILPELTEGVQVEQGGMHHEDVFAHALTTCQMATHFTDKPIVRFASLLHDIGKSRTVLPAEGRNTFHSHEQVGSRMAKAIMRRLKASNEQVATVEALVKHHMFQYESCWTDSAVRRFMRRVGVDLLEDLFALRLSDQAAIHGRVDYTLLAELSDRIAAIIAAGDALTVKDLAIDGNDLMALGIPKGKQIGQTLSYLLETVLDDPAQNTVAQLTEIAKNYGSLIKDS